MKNQNDKKKIFAYLEMEILAILLALVITYYVLYLMLPFGNHGLFFGGAIVGGLWGNIWNLILFFDKRLIQDSCPASLIGFFIVCLCFIFISSFIVFPLPTN